MKRTRVLVFAVILLALKITVADAASKPPILPPSSHAYGKTYEEWSAAWLRWALSIPAASNPILDTTGAFASVGQSGKVWFLAGTTGTGAVPPVVREISVPTGTALFFPIINKFWVNTPEYGDPEWSPVQEAAARDFIAASIDAATDISLIIDGRPVPNLNDFRFKSTAAECVIPPLAAENIFAIDLLHSPYHCVADGYWAMIPPLSVGLHTVRFTGSEPNPFFSLDVTYKISVNPAPRVEVPLHP